ncbi:MAG TPA: hypothetical protein DF383_04980 [Deltaproteobacteria bacterium]|nr:hypothetical protein [Deltaproteobacteria bacterium]
MRLREFLRTTFIAVFGFIFTCIMLLFPVGVSFAQESRPSNAEELLQQCVDYFVNGQPVDWVLGGVFLLVTILGLFFRVSVLSIVKDFIGKILGLARK